MTYFAIRTEPGRLPIVRRLLKRQGHDVYLPAEIRRNHKRRKRIVVPMMPYIFIRAPAPELQALWQQQISGTRYVKAFICTSAMAGPHPIADHKIEVLRRTIQDFRFNAKAERAKRCLKPGSRAIVKNGHLAGRKGTVSWTHGNRVKLEAYIFGRATIVEVAVKDLEAA